MNISGLHNRVSARRATLITLAAALLAGVLLGARAVDAHRLSAAAPHAPGRLVWLQGGRPLRRQPELGGNDVASAISDGRGGWYVGGLFRGPGGLRNLVHIDASGDVDPGFRPDPDLGVDALALRGSTLYVGGYFQQIGGRRRRTLAAVDARTGKATRWAPKAPVAPEPPGAAVADPLVYALTLSGRTLYVGGRVLAAFDTRTARRLKTPQARGEVMALAVAGHTLYFGGSFDEVAGLPRQNVAAIDARTRRLLPFAPAVACDCEHPIRQGNVYVLPVGVAPPPPSPPEPPSWIRLQWPALDYPSYVDALAVTHGRVYIGGNFNNVNGTQRQFLAAVRTTSGRTTAFAPHIDAPVFALTAGRSGLYAGTGFRDSIRPGRYAWKVDPTTGATRRWGPHPSGPVQAIVLGRDRAYLGGAPAICPKPRFCYVRRSNPSTG
jgi:hypothetical protein